MESKKQAERQAELTRIVALRGCGHVAAFRSVEELLRGRERCPVCARQPYEELEATAEARA